MSDAIRSAKKKLGDTPISKSEKPPQNQPPAKKQKV
jgi:hypothetical protein